MLVQRANQPATAEHPAQNQEADLKPVLSPRITSRRLLSLELRWRELKQPFKKFYKDLKQ